MKMYKTTAVKKRPDLLVQLEKSRLFFKPIPGSSEVLTHCPEGSCTGKEPKLYINILKKVGYCQRCKAAFNYSKLCSSLRLPLMASTEAAPSAEQLKDMYSSLFEASTRNAPSELPECELPLGAHLAIRYPVALKYLLARGVQLRDIQKHEIRYCPYGPYYKRILFPVSWNGKLVGFNTRYIGKGTGFPKYMTNPGFPSSQILYPQENLSMGRLIITEGVIPALIYGGVATFGKKLSQNHLKILIRSRGIKQVTLAWDRDAWSSNVNQDPPALQAWEKIKEFFPCAGLILPAEKPQPDDFSRSDFQQIVENVWRKHEFSSSIWKVSKQGETKRFG